MKGLNKVAGNHSLSLFNLCDAGGSSRFSVRPASVPVCGALSGLADVGEAMECFPEAARTRPLSLPLWPVALDRQHRPHLRLP